MTDQERIDALIRQGFTDQEARDYVFKSLPPRAYRPKFNEEEIDLKRKAIERLKEIYSSDELEAEEKDRQIKNLEKYLKDE